MRSPGRAHPRHIPIVPAGPHRSGRDRPVRQTIMAAAILFVSAHCPLARATRMHSRPKRCWISSGARIGGARQSAGSTSGTVRQRPTGRETQSHGVGPQPTSEYRLGGVWPAGHGGLVRGLIPPPNAQHSCHRCLCADQDTLSPGACPVGIAPELEYARTGLQDLPRGGGKPSRKRGGGTGDPKAKEDPSPMRRGPRWPHSEGGPLAHAAGAPVVPKRKRPPSPCGGGPGGPKAKGAPSSMRWGPRWSQSEGGHLAHAAGASVVPKRKRPPRPCGGGPGGPKAKGAPSSMRPGPRWSPKRRRLPHLCGGGPGGPKAKEAPSPLRRGPRWSQSEGGPLTHAAGDLVVPKRRRPPRPCGGGLGGPKAKEVPSPMRWGPRWSQSERGPPHPCGRGPGGPKAKEALSSMRPGPRWSPNEEGPPAYAVGPRWSQSEGGPLAHAAGA